MDEGGDTASLPRRLLALALGGLLGCATPPSTRPLDASGAPELALAARPAWAQWRSEGQGVARFLLHARAYRTKARALALQPFPGQAQASLRLPDALAARTSGGALAADEVRLGFVGDLMPSEGGLSPRLKSRLAQVDLLVGNLETPVSPSGSLLPLWTWLSAFNAPPAYLAGLRRDGRSLFAFLSTANNHVLDRGDVGVRETLDALAREGIATHGVTPPDQPEVPFATVSRHGLTVGIAAATWGTNPQPLSPEARSRVATLPGLAPLDPAQIDLRGLTRALAAMKSTGVDFKVLVLHWGYEFELYPDPEIQAAARALIDAGADLIVGAHPHVLQPFEVVHAGDRDGFVAYSMGNFLTDMTPALAQVGLLQELWLRKAAGRTTWRLGPHAFTHADDGGADLIDGESAPDVQAAERFYARHLGLQPAEMRPKPTPN